MAAPSTLQLLGGASIEGPDGPLTGRATQRPRLALLALLAAEPRGMTREKVVTLLWPEREPSRARHALSDSIYRINDALETEAVVATGGRDLRLDAEALPSDLDAFRRALEDKDWLRATEVYGGPFLDGFHLSESVEFDRWMDGERRRLARRYAGALESLAEERAEDGDPSGAVTAWRRRAGLDPYDSRVTARLMEALEAAGNRAAALRHAAAHAELLEREFGTGPDPEVVDLAERIRNRGAPGPGSAAEPPAAEADPSPAEAQREPREEAEGPAALEPVPAGAGFATTEGSARPGDGPRAGAWRRIGLGAGVILAGSLVALWSPDVASVFSRPAERAPPPGEPTGLPADDDGEALSVAVLPFEDLSPLGDREWFAHGMAEEVARTLSEVPGLRVPGLLSSFAFGDGSADARRIADTLGVDVLLDGSLRSGGDSVWITVELVDGATGYYLWNETYATSPTSAGLRSAQRHIALEVAAALSLRVAEAPAGDDPVSDRAYDAYLEGRAVLRRVQSGGSTEPREVLTSLDYFREAVDLEPRWADGWAGLGEAHHWAAYMGFDREEHWARSKRALQRAVLLDPEHARANASLGFVLHRLDHDYEAAETRLQRALALDSDQYWHCGYSFFLLWAARYEEAVEATRRAEAHNPLSWRRKALRVTSERCAGGFGEAVRRAERVLVEEPGAGGTRRDLALALQRLGRVDEALERLDEVDGPRAYLDLVRVLVLARSGRVGEAGAILRAIDLGEAEEWTADRYPVSEVTAAPLHAAALVALGRRRAAVEALQSAVEREPDVLLYDRCYPELATLEEDPRYRELLRRTGVPGW